jgi:hypothetical protein
MATISKKGRIFLKGAAGVVAGILTFPVAGFGVYFLACWVRLHVTSAYYYDYPYGTVGTGLVLLATIVLWITLYGVFRRSFKGLLLALSLFLAFAAAVQVPNLIPPDGRVRQEVYLAEMAPTLRAWYETHHQFPSSEAEFENAASAWRAHGASYAPSARQSGYRQQGHPLAYEVVITSNATGPRVSDVSERPAVIYYCVSGDLQEFWLTMTNLPSDIGSKAEVVHSANPPSEPLEMIYATGRDYAASGN